MKIQSVCVLFLVLCLVEPSSLNRSRRKYASKSQNLFQTANTTAHLSSQIESDGLLLVNSRSNVSLGYATIDQLQDYLSNRSLSSQDLVRYYFQRFQQLNPYVKGILQLNPDALKIAKERDEERTQGLVRGPLHGIPFLVKDNYATKDKMETTCGSWSLLGSVVPRDAFVVAKLRDAGAVLLGHTTLSEWADMRSSCYSEGYSARGGQARCPFDLSVSPGGSSSGSAVAVAADMVTFSLGTETDGSIIDPAMKNGIVGFKPTVGLTSRAGVVPESEHQDSTGPMARTVRDAVYAFQYMWGVDERDVYTLNQTGHVPQDGDYVEFLSDKDSLKGARFGIPWQKLWTLAEKNEISRLAEVIKMIESAGATIYNNTNFKNLDVVSSSGWDWNMGPANESEFTVVKVDFFNNIESYLSELENSDMRSLKDIVEYNSRNYETEGGTENTHHAFQSGQDSFMGSLSWGGVQNETYWQAVEFVQKTSRGEGIDYALNYTDPETGENFNLDGLLVPSGLPITHQQAAKAGYPMITLPVASKESNGRPFGLGIMQSAWEEPKLIKYGSAIEDLLNYKLKPWSNDNLDKNISTT